MFEELIFLLPIVIMVLGSLYIYKSVRNKNSDEYQKKAVKKVLRAQHDIPSVAKLLNVPERILTKWVEDASNSSTQSTEQIQINELALCALHKCMIIEQ